MPLRGSESWLELGWLVRGLFGNGKSVISACRLLRLRDACLVVMALLALFAPMCARLARLGRSTAKGASRRLRRRELGGDEDWWAADAAGTASPSLLEGGEEESLLAPREEEGGSPLTPWRGGGQSPLTS